MVIRANSSARNLLGGLAYLLLYNKRFTARKPISGVAVTRGGGYGG